MGEWLSIVIAICSFVVGLVIQIFSAGVFIGGLFMAIKYIEKQLKRLEDKQDKHNGLIERMATVEQSTKSAHRREDELLERVKNIEGELYEHK